MRIEGPVLLYGAGREARSTCAFLKARYPGVEVFVTADKGGADIPGATFVPADNLDPARFGTVVKSPGVSLYKPFFESARTAGVAVTSNLNLWGAHHRAGCKVIAITGTKGKSTTASLAALMLKKSGVAVTLAGNVGTAPLDIGEGEGVVIFELSSYQTADMDFAPDVAAITTLYPEHVDWHGSAERYYRDKLNLIARDAPMSVALGQQAASSSLVRAAIPGSATVLPSLEAEIDALVTKAVTASRLKGPHNLDNARLAATIALESGATPQGLAAAIAQYHPLPHRLEEIQVGAFLFVDDSISTTPEATKAALVAFSGRKIALIAGGHEREQDYSELAEMVGNCGVVMVCCLPVTGTRLAAAIRTAAPHVPVAEARSLEGAIQMLAGTGWPFDTVILSPGAPSYNQFLNFEERGETFKALARSYFDQTGTP